jgi:hypothetical protein
LLLYSRNAHIAVLRKLSAEAHPTQAVPAAFPSIQTSQSTDGRAPCKNIFEEAVGGKMKKRILALFLFFLLPGIFLSALGEWTLQTGINKFGDPTQINVQSVRGKGENSIGRTSSQFIIIGYPFSDGNVSITLGDKSGFPLNTLFRGTPEPITLNIKDSANKSYEFRGDQISDNGVVWVVIDKNSGLVDLLRRKDSYSTVIEGDRWSCSFTFNGGMP